MNRDVLLTQLHEDIGKLVEVGFNDIARTKPEAAHRLADLMADGALSFRMVVHITPDGGLILSVDAISNSGEEAQLFQVGRIADA